MTRNEPQTRHVLISGRVQGVGFRYWVQQEALRRGLQGFVRNRRDGAVEAAFSGPADAVATMLEACREGPPGSAVTSIAPVPETPGEKQEPRQGECFSILSTV
jgi:acylphosphatase